MKYILNFISDLFFPNRCPCCDCFITAQELICDDCKSKLICSDYCKICGNSECICKENEVPCNKAYCLCDYEDVAKQGVVSYKSGENRNFAHFMGIELGRMLERDNIKADYVVFAPMTKRSYTKRRFNHAKLMANHIAKATNAKVLSAFTVCENSLAQHTLNASQRRKNAQNISIKPIDLSEKSVIFCDDITTSGSTMLRCVSLLKQSGAEKIYCAFGAKTNLSKGKN